MTIPLDLFDPFPSRDELDNWSWEHLEVLVAALTAWMQQQVTLRQTHMFNMKTPGGTDWHGDANDAAVDLASNDTNKVMAEVDIAAKARQIAMDAIAEQMQLKGIAEDAIQQVEAQGFKVQSDWTPKDLKYPYPQTPPPARAALAGEYKQDLILRAQALQLADRETTRQLGQQMAALRKEQFSPTGQFTIQPVDNKTKTKDTPQPDPDKTAVPHAKELDQKDKPAPPAPQPDPAARFGSQPRLDPSTPEGRQQLEDIRQQMQGAATASPCAPSAPLTGAPLTGAPLTGGTGTAPLPSRNPLLADVAQDADDEDDDPLGHIVDGFKKGVGEEIQNVENLFGLGGPGAPGVAESWERLGEGLAEENTWHILLGPAGEMFSDAEDQWDATDPGEEAGRRAVGVAMGAPFLALPLGKDIARAGEGAAPRAPVGEPVPRLPAPEDAPAARPGEPAPPPPRDEPPAAAAPREPVKPDTFDPNIAKTHNYTSGDPLHPGESPPHSPNPGWQRGDTDPDWKHIHHKVDKDWIPYQEQISGVDRTPDGHLPEYVQPDPDTGSPVDFDGHTYRNGHEVFLEAKDGFRGLAFAPDSSYWEGRAEKALDQVERQLAALPPGATLEWHVSDPYGAAALRKLFLENGIEGVEVIYTPKEP